MNQKSLAATALVHIYLCLHCYSTGYHYDDSKTLVSTSRHYYGTIIALVPASGR